jgi:hypothetical protein
MKRANPKTSIARVKERRGRVVIVNFDPEPPKPAAPAARIPRPLIIADAIAEDHPATVPRRSDLRCGLRPPARSVRWGMLDPQASKSFTVNSLRAELEALNLEALALELAIAGALAKGVIDNGAFGEALAEAASRLTDRTGDLSALR